MTLTALLVSQFTDPFRIGMLIALMITAARTRSVNGLVVPLIAGTVFVALIIPMFLSPAGNDIARQTAVGVVVNAVFLAAFYAARTLVRPR